MHMIKRLAELTYVDSFPISWARDHMHCSLAKGTCIGMWGNEDLATAHRASFTMQSCVVSRMGLLIGNNSSNVTIRPCETAAELESQEVFRAGVQRSRTTVASSASTSSASSDPSRPGAIETPCWHLTSDESMRRMCGGEDHLLEGVEAKDGCAMHFKRIRAEQCALSCVSLGRLWHRLSGCNRLWDSWLAWMGGGARRQWMGSLPRSELPLRCVILRDEINDFPCKRIVEE